MRAKIFFSFCVKIICFFLLVGLYFFFNSVVNSSSSSGEFPKIKLVTSEKKTSTEEIVETLNTVKNTDKTNCSRWIVITTISLPTDDIKYIHDSSFDWCIVVVADKKTPANWSYKNVVFLSVKVQEQMAKRFKVLR